MVQAELAVKVRELKSLKVMAEELETQISSIENEIKAEMAARETDEIPFTWTNGSLHFDDGSSVDYSQTRGDIWCIRHTIHAIAQVRPHEKVCRAEAFCGAYRKERIAKTFDALLEAWGAVLGEFSADDFHGINRAMFDSIKWYDNGGREVLEEVTSNAR